MISILRLKSILRHKSAFVATAVENFMGIIGQRFDRANGPVQLRLDFPVNPFLPGNP